MIQVTICKPNVGKVEIGTISNAEVNKVYFVACFVAKYFIAL
jgi:hypothetical protein